MRKIAFIGAGSIGKRHIRNLYRLLENRQEDFTIDLIRSGYGNELDSETEKYISNIYIENLDDIKAYDIIFVTNPTSLHHNTIKKYSSHTKHMFIEKPVFGRDDFEYTDINFGDGQYYVACPMRYEKTLQYLKKNVNFDEVISLRAISSSYLPEWRPGQDYRKTYSAHKDMGGGVSIDLIHEWDYITWLIGEFPLHVENIIGKYSNLEIDSDDSAIYMAKYCNKTVELHLDYYGRHTIRQLMIFLPDETIDVDLQNGYIRFLKSGRLIKLIEDRDDYQLAELDHFLDICDGIIENDNTIQQAVEVLKIANGGKR